MTTAELIWAFIGFVICAVIFALVSIVIMGIVWYVFKTDKEIIPKDEEEDYE